MIITAKISSKRPFRMGVPLFAGFMESGRLRRGVLARSSFGKGYRPFYGFMQNRFYYTIYRQNELAPDLLPNKKTEIS
ncbi:MAG: hypothetical protein FWF69_06255 [Firmicutes bacterium]|nr:hypothetical protein [Bacillota bacterium]